VVGCNGYNAETLAEFIRENWPAATFETHEQAIAEWVYMSAEAEDFGCEDDRVVMTESHVIFKGDGALPDRYRETFWDVRFNPRWEEGTAPYVVVLKVEDLDEKGALLG
jgi:hypothetical protein